jgi:hypothetical protein
MQRWVHIILSLCAVPNIVVFLLIPPTGDIPNWAIPSIFVTGAQLITIKWSARGYECEWDGFTPNYPRMSVVFRWLFRLSILLILPGLFFFLYDSKMPPHDALPLLYRSVSWLFLALNCYYLSFAFFGDGVVVSKRRKRPNIAEKIKALEKNLQEMKAPQEQRIALPRKNKRD